MISETDDLPPGAPPPRVVVIGGGPAGLTAAYVLGKAGLPSVVLEASDQVGGISRTEVHRGYRFDIGGHRFFTKIKPVEQLWEEIIGPDFITVPRASRIYYGGKFYDYPLRPLNALRNLGPVESVRILASYARWKLRPNPCEDNFEQWVTNRFGRRLFRHFFQTYTEKVWGLPCTEIRADWAAQRIKNLSLGRAVLDALTSRSRDTSLIKSFRYPRLGPGMMWEACRDRVRAMGGEVRMDHRTTRVSHAAGRVTAVTVQTEGGGTAELPADQVISSMPLPSLIRALDPPAPAEVRAAADGLNYRDFLIVTLILRDPDPFPDNWIYIHSPDVMVGRIQNFRSWSRAMVPDDTTSSIGMEYFCHRGDGLWNAEDDTLIARARTELAALGLGRAESVIDAKVIRQPKAYPVYDAHYKRHVAVLRDYLQTFENLQTVGRNGMHRYNNQDHSMLTAMLAARNVLGERHDVWDVNVERSYHEDFVTDKPTRDRDAANGATA